MFKKEGFTLIEMSIVLVVIGLIIGGVLVGKEMIWQTKMRKIISDVNDYTMAIQQFNDKYGMLPGDISNARSYWPSCQNYSGGNNCNGNGNGRLTSDWFECFRAWEHLSLAKMVKGSYVGNFFSPAPPWRMGESGPKGSLPKTGFIFRESSMYGLTGNTLIFADIRSPSLITGRLGSFDTRALDKKMDDGIADGGKLRTYDNANNCARQYWATESFYRLSNASKTCVPVFFLD